MKTHGDAGWESFPSYLDLVVPRFLEILDDFGWKITVFVVGQDAALEKNREALQNDRRCRPRNRQPLIQPRAVACTSTRSSRSRTRSSAPRKPSRRQPVSDPADSAALDTAFREMSSRFLPTVNTSMTRPRFRPTSAPLHVRTTFSNLTSVTTKNRKEGSYSVVFVTGFSRSDPITGTLATTPILEIPVTTLPVLKIPFPFQLSAVPRDLSPPRSQSCTFALRSRYAGSSGIQPSLLLHPLDFLGRADAPELRFFPSMNLEASQKLDLLKRLLSSMELNFSVVNMSEHYRLASKRVLTRRKAPQGIPAKESGADSG